MAQATSAAYTMGTSKRGETSIWKWYLDVKELRAHTYDVPGPGSYYSNVNNSSF